MEPRPIYERLLDYALGESTPAETQEIRNLLERDPELREETARMRYVIDAVRDVPVADVSEEALQRMFSSARETVPAMAEVDDAADEIAPVIHARFGFWSYATRIAAALLIAAAVIFGLSQMPSGPGAPIAKVVDGEHSYWVHNGDTVESGIGSRPTISFATGSVLLDGASAVRVVSDGSLAPVRIDIDRGRAVATATSAGIEVRLAEQTLSVEPGATVALEYERPFNRVSPDGREVEVQRLTLVEAAKLGSGTYGVNIDASGLPAEVAKRRISFTGADMNAEAFVASLVEAASRFGVNEARDGKKVSLVYGSATERNEGLDEAAVSIAMLQGSATLTRAGAETRLRADKTDNAYGVTTSQGAMVENRSSDAMARMVVWAGGAGNAAIESHLRDVAVRTGRLPQGSVIHTDRLVLHKAEGPERVFLLGGPEFTFPLPQGRMGRVVGLMSSGAEFEVEGEIQREFIPLSMLSR